MPKTLKAFVGIYVPVNILAKVEELVTLIDTMHSTRVQRIAELAEYANKFKRRDLTWFERKTKEEGIVVGRRYKPSRTVIVSQMLEFAISQPDMLETYLKDRYLAVKTDSTYAQTLERHLNNKLPATLNKPSDAAVTTAAACAPATARIPPATVRTMKRQYLRTNAKAGKRR